MKRLLLYALLLGTTGALMPLLSTDTKAPFLTTQQLSSLQQKKMKEIARMIWDKKPEKKILKVWEIFVEMEKRNKINFKEAIKIIFDKVRIIGEKNVQIAQEKIRQANILKAEIEREMENIRNLRSRYARLKRFKPIKRKKFKFSNQNPPKAIIQEAGYISSIKKLSEYESHIQWGGKEASLQGSGGVALLEFAKDAIQTAASNISGVGTQAIKMRKIVERKISQ